jgi:hypothetical protein
MKQVASAGTKEFLTAVGTHKNGFLKAALVDIFGDFSIKVFYTVAFRGPSM